MHAIDPVSCEWFAAQVWTGREQLCATHLRARGYHIFLPCYLERRQWSDRIKTMERPLFAGYVFCRLAADVTAKIVTTPGVIRIVGDGMRPLPVPAHEIEAIHRIVNGHLPVEPWTRLQPGQSVRVTGGPLRGVEGVVITAKGVRRLVVSIPLLQRSIAVEIEPEWISVTHCLTQDASNADRSAATRYGVSR